MNIILLDVDFEFYNLSENGISKSFVLKREFIGERLKPLNLSESFESIWKRNLTNNDTEILFLIGSRASFTDTRVIWVWLKSNNLFNGVNFYFNKFNTLMFDQAKQLINGINVKKLVQSSVKNPVDVNYIKQPNIG